MRRVHLSMLFSLWTGFALATEMGTGPLPRSTPESQRISSSALLAFVEEWRQLLEPDDVPLDSTLDAMRALAEGRLAGKVLVKPS